MGGGNLIPKVEVTKAHTDIYWSEIDGDPIFRLPLKKSRAVSLEANELRRRSRFSDAHKQRSARTNPETGALLETGIQIYRHWFQFLKLALELESLGVTRIITKQGAYDRSKAAQDGGGMRFRTREWEPIQIVKARYEGWDLEQVLSSRFDQWWKTHAHLFEGYPPSFIEQGNNPDPAFINLRIDPATKLEDLNEFIRTQVQPRLTKKRLFKVSGYPRPPVLQNAYNALVLSLQGWNPKEICENQRTYLRATDLRSGSNPRLKVSVTKDGKALYPIVVQRQRNNGIHHLLNVMKGKFGEAI